MRPSTQKTKKKIMLDAFVLFSTRQYNDVTLVDIEQATGLSKGTLFYHFKSKQDLFSAVVETNLLSDRVSILDIPIREKDTLKLFIEDYISNCEIRKQSLTDLGVKNVSPAYSIIESSALAFFDDFGKRFRQMRDIELGIWTQVITKAMEKREIMNEMAPEVLASLFMDLFLGYINVAAKEEEGVNVEQLRKKLLSLYDLAKTR